MACCGIAFASVAIHPAAAKDAPRVAAARTAEHNLPAVKFDGKHAATLRYGDLTVTLGIQGLGEQKQKIVKGKY